MQPLLASFSSFFSTFASNSSGAGAGIESEGAVTVIGSTFTENTAIASGGGLDNFGTATVSGSTFTANSAGSGNGGLNNEVGGVLTQSDNRFVDDQLADVFP